jgi:hypothetical protein
MFFNPIPHKDIPAGLTPTRNSFIHGFFNADAVPSREYSHNVAFTHLLGLGSLRQDSFILQNATRIRAPPWHIA